MTSDMLVAFAKSEDGIRAINNYDLIDFLQATIEHATNTFTVGAIEALIKWLSSCKPETFEHLGWQFTIFLDDDNKVILRGMYFEDAGLFIYIEDLKKLLHALVTHAFRVLDNLDIVEDLDELKILVANLIVYLDDEDPETLCGSDDA